VTGLFRPTEVSSWGRTPRVTARLARPSFTDELRDLVLTAGAQPNHLLASGLRRSYGDSGLNDGGAMLDMTSLDRFVSFDRTAGHLVAEAGVSLAEILKLVVPAGFFPPVIPGTKFVTLGGAVANDVHGKNHHRAGTIGRWVDRLDMLRGDGAALSIDRSDSTGLFAATIGGLGLTGIITHVALELMPIASSDISVESIPFGNLAEFFQLAADSERDHDYTVAWIDCLAKGPALGRGIFQRASHSRNGNLRVHAGAGPSIPMDAPGFLLNRLTLSAFNALYYRLNGRRRLTTVAYNAFFFPLDVIGSWNRLYGRRGFYQYQSVIPPGAAEAATAEMLRTIAQAGQGSFLAVLKTFGDVPSPGLLSFPMKGTTLALDFPNHGLSTLSLLDRLDAIVREAGGRLYPAKDGRLPAEMFRGGYKALEQFRTHVDPAMSSTFWRRMNP
jgi:L-gulonolactone oxidase